MTSEWSSYETVKTLAAGTAEGLMAVDGKYQIVYWNQTAEHLTGYPSTETLGRYCYDVMRGVGADEAPFCRLPCSLMLAAEGGKTLESLLLIYPDSQGQKHQCFFDSVVVQDAEESLLIHFFHKMDWIPLSKSLPLPSDSASPQNLDDATLTQREREVMALLAKGRSPREISRDLHISYATARNHVQNVIQKLGVHSRIEAVLVAIKESTPDST